jgi:hypothetical protein
MFAGWSMYSRMRPGLSPHHAVAGLKIHGIQIEQRDRRFHIIATIFEHDGLTRARPASLMRRISAASITLVWGLHESPLTVLAFNWVHPRGC